MPEKVPEALTAELETLLVREIVGEWARVNWAHFGRRLRTPVFSLVDSETLLARWMRETRAIEISRILACARPWGELVEVLKHEMAHQYVDEWLGVHDEPPHGPTFQKVCGALGIDARASGLPHVDDPNTARVLDRIKRLLSLAASENQHEAETAMRAARKLMLEHNLGEVAARAERGFVYRHLGKPTGRRADHERYLARILADHFFVETIVVGVYRPLEGKTGSVLEVVGTETNVAMAAYVHDFLLHAAERLWREHKRALGIRIDRERRSFLSGVMRGFLDKLDAEKKQNTSSGLVWVGDPALDRFQAQRHPRTRTVTTQGRAHEDGFTHGRAAGRDLVLHKPVASGPSGAPIGRLKA